MNPKEGCHYNQATKLQCPRASSTLAVTGSASVEAMILLDKPGAEKSIPFYTSNAEFSREAVDDVLSERTSITGWTTASRRSRISRSIAAADRKTSDR